VAIERHISEEKEKTVKKLKRRQVEKPGRSKMPDCSANRIIMRCKFQKQFMAEHLLGLAFSGIRTG